MSSLQKFHRRTQSVAIANPFTVKGTGNDTLGYWLGTAIDNTSKLIVAPKATQVTNLSWGSYGTFRGTISITDGLANTNTLYTFGSAAHPAAYYCKTLATGGYNTWYMPSTHELRIIYSNRTTPFTTNNDMNHANGDYFLSSTEINFNTADSRRMTIGFSTFGLPKNRGNGNYGLRAIRKL